MGLVHAAENEPPLTVDLGSGRAEAIALAAAIGATITAAAIV
jgi:hypothetical protein